MTSREHYRALPEWVKQIILEEIDSYYQRDDLPFGRYGRAVQPIAAPHEISGTEFRYRCHTAIRNAAIRRVHAVLKAEGHKSVVPQLCAWFGAQSDTIFRATLPGYAERGLVARRLKKEASL
jgi:hypothetical protein